MMKSGWKPEQLEQELKNKIIGQDDYLHDLSTCLWLHNQRLEHFLRTGKRINRPKYNMLVIGKSGMGKTSTIEAAAKLLNIPVVIEDASELRGSGWKGKQVSEIVRDIYEVGSQMENVSDTELEFSIVILDEIDKVFERRTHDQSFLPINNLLKFMEGMEAGYGEGNSRLRINTHNLLFIAIGAFDGLNEIIEKRIHPKTIGFQSEREEEVFEKNILKQVTPRDLADYGVSEQFLGRLPLLTVMNELEASDYEEILLNSELSPVRQLNQLMQQEQNAGISITRKAARQLAQRVKDSALGTRALQGEVINLLKETLYSLQGDEENKEYLIEYENDFVIKPIQGKREPLQEKKRKVNFHLTEKEMECVRLVKLNSIGEDDKSIRIYAEDLFESFEAVNYEETTGEGLTDLYDYMTIKNAQIFTAAAIKEMLLMEKGKKTEKNMLTLLTTIRRLKPNNEEELPFEEPNENRFLHKMHFQSYAEMRKVKGIAWEVVRKYALLLYQYEFTLYDDVVCFE